MKKNQNNKEKTLLYDMLILQLKYLLCQLFIYL